MIKGRDKLFNIISRYLIIYHYKIMKLYFMNQKIKGK